MARAVVEGINYLNYYESAKIDVELNQNATPEELENSDTIIIGTPTYHHDMPDFVKDLLEEIAMKKVNLQGKLGTTFGSYGWSGEAPRLVLEVMEKKYGMKILKPPLLIKFTPREKGLEECRNLGKKVGKQTLTKLNHSEVTK